jgi:hypothetical protein
MTEVLRLAVHQRRLARPPYHPRGAQVAATTPNRHCPSVLGRVKGSRSRKLARRRNAALDTACAR